MAQMKTALESTCGSSFVTNITQNLLTSKKNDPQFYEDLDYPVLGPGFSQVPGTVFDLKNFLSFFFQCMSLLNH